MEKVINSAQQNKTPLMELINVLVKNRIFPNQTIAYRALVVLTGYEIRINNKIQSYTTDDLILQIRKFLQCDEEDRGQYDKLHEKIGNVLINGDFLLNKNLKNRDDMLSLNGKEVLRSNVNHILHGQRKISAEWIKEYKRNGKNVEMISDRIYWVLQYYLAFYDVGKQDVYRHYQNVNEGFMILSSRCIRKILGELQQSCREYLCVLSYNIEEKDYGMWTISRVISELISVHCCLHEKSNAPCLEILEENKKRECVANEFLRKNITLKCGCLCNLREDNSGDFFDNNCVNNDNILKKPDNGAETCFALG